MDRMGILHKKIGGAINKILIHWLVDWWGCLTFFTSLSWPLPPWSWWQGCRKGSSMENPNLIILGANQGNSLRNSLCPHRFEGETSFKLCCIANGFIRSVSHIFLLQNASKWLWCCGGVCVWVFVFFIFWYSFLFSLLNFYKFSNLPLPTNSSWLLISNYVHGLLPWTLLCLVPNHINRLYVPFVRCCHSFPSWVVALWGLILTRVCWRHILLGNVSPLELRLCSIVIASNF